MTAIFTSTTYSPKENGENSILLSSEFKAGPARNRLYSVYSTIQYNVSTTGTYRLIFSHLNIINKV